jgi:hypothetical protein
MTTRVLSLLACLLASTGAMNAGVIITLDPASGALQALPGATTGWGFTVTPDSNSTVSVISSFLENETNSSLGVYTDLIGVEGGPNAGVLASTDPIWTEAFSYDSGLGTGTGLGAYQIDPAAKLGDTDSGDIRVEYELFSESSLCPGCYLGTESFEVPFTVNVGTDPAVAPEPNSLNLAAAAICLALGWRFKRSGKPGRVVRTKA